MNRAFNWDSLPVSLTPRDLPKILPIGREAAYSLCHSPGFPVVKIGRKFLISRDALRLWFENRV